MIMNFYWIIENLRWEILNINSNEPSFNPYNISVNGCSYRCNSINNPYARLCVLNVLNTNVKVFNLVSRINETRYKSWHETCRCRCC